MPANRHRSRSAGLSSLGDLTVPLPTYYRDQTLPSGAAPAGTPTPANPIDPKYDGVLWGMANAANVGPLRALMAKSVRELFIPCAVAPAGTPNSPILLSKNADIRPKFVRARLHRPVGAVEGRVLLGFTSNLGDQSSEFVDLTKETGYHFDAILLNGEEMWALGAWVGVVPLTVAVSVAEWSP